MADQLEMVALALLWTEGAHQKPRRRVVPPADDLPPPRLCDAQTLEAALILGGTHDVEARAASLRARAAMALDAGRASGLDVVVRGDPAYPDLLRHIP
ncbi:MAG: hypothetical protein NTY02_17280, partial [Acidobacteria bacterium]|nr:hypothetical protein [Acidobacteriota bacterium]